MVGLVSIIPSLMILGIVVFFISGASEFRAVCPTTYYIIRYYMQCQPRLHNILFFVAIKKTGTERPGCFND